MDSNLSAVPPVWPSPRPVNMTMGRPQALLYTLNYNIDFTQVSVVPRAAAPTGEWNFQSSTSLTDRPSQETDHWGANATISWGIGDNTMLKSITAYRALETAHYLDIDATTLELGDVFVGLDQNQFSQEFQLLGGNGDDLNWVAGAYYLKEEAPSHQEAYADAFLQ